MRGEWWLLLLGLAVVVWSLGSLAGWW
ncbi:membrane protein [Arthrobacter phage Kuleana]|uniref:Uncharacterized protein n=1 Tax=Arthrobacter phage Kuleana TaxID=2653270 RepID=A0A5Q2WC66_9CAUD|nr:membrane protein [Arthrobacter phage Kuleana]QGH74561.1 hypothetical protein SEA_KULEANA_74 [Arthrobacter phage Kuleana]